MSESSYRFLNWQVYKDAKKFFKNILGIASKLPKEFRYELGSQLIRSSSSIILNIAEGSGKQSDKELNRFFNIASGSITETIAILDILKENNYITPKEFEEQMEMLNNIYKQLCGFKKKLKEV